jgi:hypothetical protein
MWEYPTGMVRRCTCGPTLCGDPAVMSHTRHDFVVTECGDRVYAMRIPVLVTPCVGDSLCW